MTTNDDSTHPKVGHGSERGALRQEADNCGKAATPAPDFRELFDAHDWGVCALGPRATWPLQLSMTVQMMLETPNPMFLLWGPSKNILFNGQFAEILGERALEALGASLPALWAEQWSAVEPYVSAAYAGNPGTAEEVPLRTWASDYTEVRFFSFSYTPLRNDRGEVTGTMTLCTDVTEKRHAMRRLSMERNSVFRLFNDAPGFIAMVRGPGHQFVFANRSYLTLVDRQDIVGRSVEEVLPEVAEQGFTKILDQVLATGERFIASRMPIELERGGGAGRELRYISFVYAPLKDEYGTTIGIFAEGHDVTDEVQAQEQVHLLQSKLIHLSRVSAMGTMAATLAHELNQPLSVIRNYADGAQRLFKSGGNLPKISEAIDGISKGTNKAGDIIRSLRKMTERGETKREPFHPHDVIREAVALAEMGECAALEITYSLGTGDVIIGDAVQVQQVLLNLLRNACEAALAKANGQVSISAELLDDMHLIMVDDNGEGIPGPVLPKLFGAFFSTKSEGMGMGLSISRTIVEAHGGRIWAENRSEGGARFCFTLPATKLGVEARA